MECKQTMNGLDWKRRSVYEPKSSPLTPLTLPMPHWQSQRIPLVDRTCKAINGQDQRRGGQTKNEWLELEVGERL
ncbi:hypothetical protein Tco_0757605 [Tanacetum coccineum]